MLARNALSPIEKKLKGVYTMNKERMERELSTSSLVQVLIQEATDLANLVSLYLLLGLLDLTQLFCSPKCIPDGHLGIKLAQDFTDFTQ